MGCPHARAVRSGGEYSFEDFGIVGAVCDRAPPRIIVAVSAADWPYECGEERAVTDRAYTPNPDTDLGVMRCAYAPNRSNVSNFPLRMAAVSWNPSQPAIILA